MVKWFNLHHLHISRGLELLYEFFNMLSAYFLPLSSALVCVLHAYVFCNGEARLWWILLLEVFDGMSLLSDGIDFYYGSKQHAQKMVDFLQCTVPCRWENIIFVSLRIWLTILPFFLKFLITRGFKMVMTACYQSLSNNPDVYDQMWKNYRKTARRRLSKCWVKGINVLMKELC